MELRPNGFNTPVTNDNKMEYIQRVTDFRLAESVKDEINEFLKGRKSI